MPATPTDVGPVDPTEVVLRALRSRVRGALVPPSDPGYDQARQVWNAAIDRHPAVVVRAADAADVVDVVDLARDLGVPLAVRGGGHSPAGWGTIDGGIVLDVAALVDLEVDADARVASVGAGLTWGALSEATHAHGLATPGADVAAVGVAGTALAGGMGWLMRRHGLTVDNLLDADLVTADGRLRRVTADEEPDLFWGLRGGAGNLGVVTRLGFRLHPVGTVVGGVLGYPATRDGLLAYADAVATSPDELTTISFVQRAPPLPFLPPELHGTPVHLVLPCYLGDPADADEAFAPLRSLAGSAPAVDLLRPMPYPGLLETTGQAAARRHHVVSSGYLPTLDDATVDAVVRHVEEAPSPFSMVTLRELGGAVARVDADATAFAHRDAALYLAVDGSWEDGDDPSAPRAWAARLWDAVAPRRVGAYAGFLGDGPDEVGAAYPPATYARLAALKQRHDPGTLFRSTASVAPAGAWGAVGPT